MHSAGLSNEPKVEAAMRIDDALTTLLWDIWETYPIERRLEIPNDYWEKEWDSRLKASPPSVKSEGVKNALRWRVNRSPCGNTTQESPAIIV